MILASVTSSQNSLLVLPGSEQLAWTDENELLIGWVSELLVQELGSFSSPSY